MWIENRFVKTVWRHGKYDVKPYQYETNDQFVFEYMCCFSMWLLGLYNDIFNISTFSYGFGK